HCSEDVGLDPNGRVSPDKKRIVFIRGYNLWVRTLATGEETQLTSDGVKDFGYGTDDPGFSPTDNAVLTWSPDSRKIATFQADYRGGGNTYLIRTRKGLPELQVFKSPMPGDTVVTTIQRVVIDVEKHRVVRLRMAPDQNRSTGFAGMTGEGCAMADTEWTSD